MDRQQPSKRYKQIKSAYTNIGDDNNQLIGTKKVSWDHIDRRSGKDRREDDACRGRWLESRAEKDRRQIAHAIYVKI